ncbi:hypothetical protein, partial [Nocardia sp. NPDC057455]|uniref:hypothetical protein n=1 Tax=Nocardia sp. NPDC057455 TaxID=3346138 RepID=UPI00366DBFDB
MSDVVEHPAQRTSIPGSERSETEHVPFAARLAFARPPRPRLITGRHDNRQPPPTACTMPKDRAKRAQPTATPGSERSET